MDQTLKTTPLHEWHIKAGAKMAEFGGFQMPLWYPSGVKAEHLAVLQYAGIFDTSHMDSIIIEGDKAFDLLNYCFTKNITALESGKCTYGAFLDSRGHCIDDGILYKFNSTQYMVCVNASMGQIIKEHLYNHSNSAMLNIENKSQKLAKIDVQGPGSAKILSNLIKQPEMILNSMKYFSFKGKLFDSGFEHQNVNLRNGMSILLSRTGYTGELGFEIFLDPNDVADLWELILSTENLEIIACGLGARDSLRTGACLPLSHQDIGDLPFINHPWESALPYNKDKKSFNKDFLGSKSLLNLENSKYTYPFIGESLRKVSSNGNASVINTQGENIGRVLTCATDMGLGLHDNSIISINSNHNNSQIKGLSCGFILVDRPLEPGTRLTLTEGKRKINVSVIKKIRPDTTASRNIQNFL